MEENEQLKKELERFEPRYEFKYTEEISASELEQAIRTAFPNISVYKGHDSIYHLVKWEELLEWLNLDSLSEIRWIEDIFDCDDFADESACRIHWLGRIQNKNFAYRIAWGMTPLGYHAFCVAYVLKDDAKKINVIEPQNDDTREWKMSDYKPDFIKI